MRFRRYVYISLCRWDFEKLLIFALLILIREIRDICRSSNDYEIATFYTLPVGSRMSNVIMVSRYQCFKKYYIYLCRIIELKLLKKKIEKKESFIQFFYISDIFSNKIDFFFTHILLFIFTIFDSKFWLVILIYKFSSNWY